MHKIDFLFYGYYRDRNNTLEQVEDEITLDLPFIPRQGEVIYLPKELNLLDVDLLSLENTPCIVKEVAYCLATNTIFIEVKIPTKAMTRAHKYWLNEEE